MAKKDSTKVNRRNFLKILGTGTVATTAAVVGCKTDNSADASVGKDGVPIDKMTYRINPSTGNKVSLLGYGCMRWPMRPVPDNEDEEEIDQEAVNELVDYAIAHGVNYFDTAPVYLRGKSERATGIALARYPRDKFFIATKLSTQADDREIRSRENSIALYKKSMAELQVDYIDYYLIHCIGIGGMDAIKERLFDNGILDFLLNERKEGRIRNLGWSYHGDIKVFDFLLSLDVKWDFAMIQVNYVDWKHAQGANTNGEYLHGELLKHNVPTIIMEPLRGGRLSRLNYYAFSKLKEIDPEATPASWAFRYVASLPNVFTVLSGMTYMEHLQENIKTYAPLKPVKQVDIDKLEEVVELFQKFRYIDCTDCDYCMPCPYGIDIPGVFSHYNRCLDEGNLPEDIQDENYKKARKAFLIGYDRNVPKLRQANHCTGCNLCSKDCPQRINIPKEMRDIDVYVEKLRQNV